MKTVLFDLDGTLLPMDQDAFAEAFTRGLFGELCRLGYGADTARAALSAAIPAILKNDGTRTNEEAFLSTFESVAGARIRRDAPALRAYYREGFSAVQATCGFTPRAREILDLLHAKGIPAVLATSPIFPREATVARIGWAGLVPEDFLHITTYETSSFCKPHLGYYREILTSLSLTPQDCLMIGNDATEDMVARELGMEVFLLTDCLINRRGVDLTPFPRGGWDELFRAVRDFIS